MSMGVNGARALYAALLSLCLGACHAAHLQVVPPPPLPAAAREPAPPAIQAEPAEFTPQVEQSAVGATNLALKRKAVGLAPVADEGEVTDLHYRLLRAMLQAGFRTVIDLNPSDKVLASFASKGSGGEVHLYGMMDDLLRIARVSRADLVLAGDIEQASAVQRHLPVRFWYDESALANYQGALESYLAERSQRIGELDGVKSEYAGVFEQAMDAFEEAMPWWQRPLHLVSTTKEEKAYRVFVDEVEHRQTAMPEQLPTAEDLRQRAADTHEKRTVDVLVAKARFQVVDPSSGEVRSVVEVEVEGTNREELVERLAATAVNALGER